MDNNINDPEMVAKRNAINQLIQNKGMNSPEVGKAMMEMDKPVEESDSPLDYIGPGEVMGIAKAAALPVIPLAKKIGTNIADEVAAKYIAKKAVELPEKTVIKGITQNMTEAPIRVSSGSPVKISNPNRKFKNLLDVIKERGE